MINRERLATLRAKEDARFLSLHPKSGEMIKAGQVNMPAVCQCHGWLSGQVHTQSL